MPLPVPSRPLPTTPPSSDVQASERYIGLPIPNSQLELPWPTSPPTITSTSTSDPPPMPKRSSHTKSRKSSSSTPKNASVQIITLPTTQVDNLYLDDMAKRSSKRNSSSAKREHSEGRNRIKHKQHRPHRSVDVHFAEPESSDDDQRVKTVRKSVTLSFAAQLDDRAYVRPRSPSTPSRYYRSPPSQDSVSSSSPPSSSSHSNDYENEKPLPGKPHQKGVSGFPTLSYVRSQYSVEILLPLPPPPSARERKHAPVIIQSQSQSFTLVGGLKAIWKRASSHVRQVRNIPANLMGQDPQRDSVVWRGFAKVPPEDLVPSQPELPVSSPQPPPPIKRTSHTSARQTMHVSPPQARPPPPPLRSSIKSMAPTQAQPVAQAQPRKLPPPLPPRSPSVADNRHARSFSSGAVCYNPRNAMVFRDDMKPVQV